MSDISKCEGTNCPKKDTCYRFLAKENEYWQAYFVDVPYDRKISACEYYWPVKDPKHIKELNEALND